MSKNTPANLERHLRYPLIQSSRNLKTRKRLIPQTPFFFLTFSRQNEASFYMSYLPGNIQGLLFETCEGRTGQQKSYILTHIHTFHIRSRRLESSSTKGQFQSNCKSDDAKWSQLWWHDLLGPEPKLYMVWLAALPFLYVSDAQTQHLTVFKIIAQSGS